MVPGITGCGMGAPAVMEELPGIYARGSAVGIPGCGIDIPDSKPEAPPGTVASGIVIAAGPIDE